MRFLEPHHNCALASIVALSFSASSISSISGVGEKPSRAGARTAWASAGRPGRLVELGERKRRAQFDAARALPPGDGDGGLEGFLGGGISGIAPEQKFAARPVELAFVRAVAHAVASRQRFLENFERPLQIAGAHLGLGKRDLDEAVVDHDVLPAQAFGAVAHGLESIGEGAVVDRRPADKELAERSEHGEIVIAHDSSELGDARPSARTVSAHQREKGRCHGVETTTRSGVAVRNFKRPRRPRATWSSPRRVARGAIELI